MSECEAKPVVNPIEFILFLYVCMYMPLKYVDQKNTLHGNMVCHFSIDDSGLYCTQV